MDLGGYIWGLVIRYWLLAIGNWLVIMEDTPIGTRYKSALAIGGSAK